jgi:thiol-disulfide isomerase/thioredoxin
MVALGFFQSNESLLSSKQRCEVVKSGFLATLILILVVSSSLTSDSHPGLPSIAQQDEPRERNYKADEAKATLYFFTAHWCEPCHKVQPIVERLCKKHSKVVDLALIDFDSDQELVESFQVVRIPAFVLLDFNLRLVFRAEDARRETLHALATAIEKLTPTREKAGESMNPPSSTDPKPKTSNTQKTERR